MVPSTYYTYRIRFSLTQHMCSGYACIDTLINTIHCCISCLSLSLWLFLLRCLNTGYTHLVCTPRIKHLAEHKFCIVVVVAVVGHISHKFNEVRCDYQEWIVRASKFLIIFIGEHSMWTLETTNNTTHPIRNVFDPNIGYRISNNPEHF